MTLTQDFHIIQDKIRKRDFKVLKINSEPPKTISIFLETINYMMWEWCDDHKDNRTHIFDYIIIPNDIDFNFTTITFEQFMKFLSNEKSTEIEMIDIILDDISLEKTNTEIKIKHQNILKEIQDEYWTGETCKRSNGKYELGKYNNKPIELIVGLKQGILKYDNKTYKIQLSTSYFIDINGAIEIIKREKTIEDIFSTFKNIELLNGPFGRFISVDNKNIKYNSIIEDGILNINRKDLSEEMIKELILKNK